MAERTELTSPAMELAPSQARLGARAFYWVWLGQTVSAFGSSLTAFAMAVWVYQQTLSLTNFGLVLFVNAIVSALAAPALGVVCDRYPLRRLMLLGDCGSAVLTAAMLALVASSSLALWHVVIVVALDAVLNTLHQIAYRAAIPALMPKAALARANGLVESGMAASALLAPLVAGGLLMWLGLLGIFLIDLATFLFAVTTLLLARFPATSAATLEISASPSPGFWHELAAGWRYLVERPGLCGLLVVVLAASFALASVQVLFTPMILAAHDARTLGVLTTLGAAGMLLSGLFIAFRGRAGSARALLVCQALMALCLLMIGLSQSLWLLGGMLFATYVFSQWGSIAARTIWQSEVEASMRGRVFALLSASSAALVPIAYLAAPMLAEGVLQPWLQSAGPVARIATALVGGTGPGSAAALLIALIGAALLLFSLTAQRHRAWRALQSITTVAPQN